MKRPLWWAHLNVWELKSGRQTFFCWWSPKVHKTWQMNLLFLADEPPLANGPPQVHKIWQTNILLPMDPPGTQNLADEPPLANGPPGTQNLADEPSSADGPLLLTSSGQQWQFHTATDIYWSRMAIWHCYWHLVVQNGNFTLLLTSSGPEWQFHIAADI